MSQIQQEATGFAAFLRDTVDAYTRRLFTFEAQTKNGFIIFLEDIKGLQETQIPILNNESAEFQTILQVKRPGNRPVLKSDNYGSQPTEQDELRFQKDLLAWRNQFDLYDKLFAAQVLNESLELVFASLMVSTSDEKEEYRRHLLTYEAKVKISPEDGTIRVLVEEAPTVEINWVPGELRSKLIRTNEEIEKLEECENISSIRLVVKHLISRVGTSAEEINNPRTIPQLGKVGIGALPAIMLRKRDSSSKLELLDQIHKEFAGGVEPTEPFKMLVSKSYVPKELSEKHQLPALPLDANEEQRLTILRTLSERHVVIQGPPGTGKTHTIANLAALLMAEGRRILITAENDHALKEVQFKLPQGMRNLLLPFFQNEGSAPLEKSVNALQQRFGNPTEISRLTSQIESDVAELLEKQKLAELLEQELVDVCQSDTDERAIGNLSLPLWGHQKLVTARKNDLDLVDRFLSQEGHCIPEVSKHLIELAEVVTADHETLSECMFPIDLPSSTEFSSELSEFRSDIASLPDPSEHDFSSLEVRKDELQKLSTELQSWPATTWGDIPFSQTEYTEWASKAFECGKKLDLGVGLSQIDEADSIQILERYIEVAESLPGKTFRELFSLYRGIPSLDQDQLPEGVVSDPLWLITLYDEIRLAKTHLDTDKTGLLVRLVDEQVNDYTAVIGPSIEQARTLRSTLLDGIGLPVLISDPNLSTHELLLSAKVLLTFVRAGGKFKGFLKKPSELRQAKLLLENLSVGGARINTVEQLERAVAFLTSKNSLEIARHWLDTHVPKTYSDSEIREMFDEIERLPQRSSDVVNVIKNLQANVNFSEPTSHNSKALVEICFQEVSRELGKLLKPFVEALNRSEGEIRVDGKGITDQLSAKRALAHLNAKHAREQCISRLPPQWLKDLRFWGTDENDDVSKSLQLCSDIASIPSWARKDEVTPSSIQRLISQSAADTRRKELLVNHDKFKNKILMLVRGCVPASPSLSLLEQSCIADDASKYREASRGLYEESEKANLAIRLRACFSNLESVHPKLAAAFNEKDVDIASVLRRLPELEEFRDHRSLVRTFSGSLNPVEVIHDKIARSHLETRDLEARVAENRCWVSALERLKQDRSLAASLSALVNAIGSVPKTRTAKTYARRIKGVREATRNAAPAIPCWLMSIDRIPEVINDFRNTPKFDVVIVDEASQAWFPNLFLYAIAEQVIIVGDDMQTSPTAGGVLTEEEIRAIVGQHIPSHRLATQVGDDLSIYDVASAMTAPVTLVDHFRCVPQIIAISNRLSYEPKGKALLPIRRYSKERLEAVRRIAVKGFRKSSAAPNEIEIEELVNRVVECVGDARYRNKSLGVVVVGSNTTAHIKQLRERLISTVGPSVMTKRNLVVGRASEFQGSERDVIFLSLVDCAPPGKRITTRPLEYSGKNRKFVQQLNVATSRARDQLWIFHSFGSEDLGLNDARQRILLEDRIDQVGFEEQIKKCNNFESDVALAIRNSMPDVEIEAQVGALGYFIDLVVRTPNGAELAVECDGDRWHTKDSQLRSDLYRQRSLEKIGWTFYRFLASEWYADPSIYLNEIEKRLASLATDVISPSVEVFSNYSFEQESDKLFDPLADELIHDESAEIGEAELPELVLEQQVTPSTLFEIEDHPLTDVSQARLGLHDESLEAASFTKDALPKETLELLDSLTAISSQVDESKPPLTRSEIKSQNRDLAAALRELGKNPNGADWLSAKDFLKKGYSVYESARLA